MTLSSLFHDDDTGGLSIFTTWMGTVWSQRRRWRMSLPRWESQGNIISCMISSWYRYLCSWYDSILMYKVYELMGVDTEKEMDIVTRKVDRVFKVMIMMMIMMMMMMMDIITRKVVMVIFTKHFWLYFVSVVFYYSFPIWWSWMQTNEYQDIGPSY